jgi:hypothetical protein
MVGISYMFSCCTVHTVMCYRVGLHLQLHDHWPASPSTTAGQLLLPGQLGTTTKVYYLELATDIPLRDGVNLQWGVTVNYFLMSYAVLTYACMQTPDYGFACFLFRLKNPEPITPLTCLSQPHGGYCLREEYACTPRNNYDTGNLFVFVFVFFFVRRESFQGKVMQRQTSTSQE